MNLDFGVCVWGGERKVQKIVYIMWASACVCLMGAPVMYSSCCKVENNPTVETPPIVLDMLALHTVMTHTRCF